MSELGQKQTLGEPNRMSALPPKADIRVRLAHVRFGPIGDISISNVSLIHLRFWPGCLQLLKNIEVVVLASILVLILISDRKANR